MLTIFPFLPSEKANIGYFKSKTVLFINKQWNLNFILGQNIHFMINSFQFVYLWQDYFLYMNLSHVMWLKYLYLNLNVCQQFPLIFTTCLAVASAMPSYIAVPADQIAFVDLSTLRARRVPRQTLEPPLPEALYTDNYQPIPLQNYQQGSKFSFFINWYLFCIFLRFFINFSMIFVLSKTCLLHFTYYTSWRRK